jgi:salicylate hydroxylase
MAPPKDFNIAIIGGGIAGLTLAIALHERNVPVQIYERAKHFHEIGAGLSFSGNAIDAMNVCHGGVQGAFAQVATHNGWPSKSYVWFDYYDGMARGMDQRKSLFSVTTNVGQNGLHRADYLNELVKLFPTERAYFGKHLEDITEAGDGKLVMRFGDGSTAEADAVIGCDGVHSRVRKILVGLDHPAAEPTYTHKYAYRGLVPMEEAIKAIGEEKARNSSFYVSALEISDI